jgi:4-amino-4-deoxy-L-arabinose transferase-like glycosyltransferase
MADVPALFWGLVGYVCLFKAWPMKTEVKRQEAGGSRFGEMDSSWGWALGGGVALGLAVLTRYGAALLIPPLVVYLLLRWWQSRNSGEVSAMPRHIGWAVLGFVVGLLPQGIYLLTHESGAGYSAFLGDWSLGNLFARTVTSADGAITNDYPMLAFFLMMPFVSADAGFMHFLSFPAYLAGMATLAQRRAWPALGLLVAWWLVPALVLSGTPYQAHRFVIMYLPALVIPVGIGVAVAVEALPGALRDSAGTCKPLTALAAGALLLGVSLGAIYEWQGTRSWMVAHVAFKEEERGVLELARGAIPPGEEPRVVAFGMTAAIYHYTGWPALDLYNHKEAELGLFLDGQGTRLVAVPEPQLDKQWADTPTGERWRWLRDNYTLELQGKAGQYTVYRVKEP